MSQRKQRFDLHLDRDDTKNLRYLAKQCGMTKTEFLRYVIRNFAVPPLRKPVKVKA